MKRLILLIIPALLSANLRAQTATFTLDSCRAMAISNNKDVRMSSIDKEIAEYNKKAAFSKFFPRVNAMGAYVYTSKDIHLSARSKKINFAMQLQL